MDTTTKKCVKCGAQQKNADSFCPIAAGGVHEWATSVIDQWNEVDERDPLPSINDLCRTVGIEAQRSEPGDRFAVDREVEMYWPLTSAR